MVLYLIGIGLGDEKDISVKGLEAVRSCSTVYLEHYTSLLGAETAQLEEFYGTSIQLASRELVEQQAEEKLLQPALQKDVALLVVGDVFGATTHADLFLRAQQAGVAVVPIFNASIMNAVGIVGLELYKYGKTTSIVFPDGNWLPHTPYDVIAANKKQGLHTLCLLDIKVAEPSRDDLRKGRMRPQDPRFMTVAQGIEVLERIENERQENVISSDMLCVGVARLGQSDMIVKVGLLEELKHFDFGAPLHSLIIPGKLHHIEEELLEAQK